MVALDIGLASLDRALYTSLEVCSWRSIVAAIISSVSLSDSSFDDDSMMFL
jgi:hypothetical protein